MSGLRSNRTLWTDHQGARLGADPGRRRDLHAAGACRSLTLIFKKGIPNPFLSSFILDTLPFWPLLSMMTLAFTGYSLVH